MLGEKLKAARKELGMSQQDLAGDDFSRSYIGAIETGRINPSAENLQTLAERLGKPLSYFLPDSNETAEVRLLALLNQAKAYLQVSDTGKASGIIAECGSLVDSGRSEMIQGLYYEVLAILAEKKGPLLQSVRYALTAAQHYLGGGLVQEAWCCRYNAAHALYITGHMTDAAEIGQSALEVVADKPQFVEAERTTAHLTGAANLALGRSEIASQYFDLALSKGSTQDDNLSIYSLLGQAACAAAHEDWQLMLEMSRSAATLATEKRLAELTVEGKVAAMCSLIQLAKFEEARRVFADALQTQGITESLKRKAHREFLLAMADKGKSEETTAEEESLRNLIAEAPQPDDTWDKLKDRWALEKCVLLRDSRSVKQVVEARSQTLIDKGRKKDAAEVLSFGARLLADQGSMGEAYQLMSRAFGLSGTK